MKILIDGLNLEQQRGTGIKTYASSVAAALCAAGHNVQLLSQLKLSKVNYVEVFDNYLARMSDLTSKSNERISLKQKRLDYVKNLLPFGDVYGEFIIDELRHLQFERELGAGWRNIASLQLNANIINTAFVKTYLGLGATKVKSSADALFLTSPIPMHFPNRPTIVTVHDLIPLTHPYLMESWNKVAKLFGSALNQSLKKASVIICVSEFSKQELLKKFDVNPDKLKVIYQPCRFEINNYQLNVSEHPLGVPKEYILYVGAIEPKKNLMSLLRAIEKNSHLPPLVIAGSFAWKSDNERAMIAKLKDRVIHEGYVTEDRLIQLIKHTKAFIFPSLVEGFGLPVLEAMWLNAPCIVSDIPVFHELFKDHVTYIDPYCSDSISDAIEKVIATPVTRDASAWVQKNFSFEKFTREIDAIMQNLQ